MKESTDTDIDIDTETETEMKTCYRCSRLKAVRTQADLKFMSLFATNVAPSIDTLMRRRSQGKVIVSLETAYKTHLREVHGEV